MGKVWDEKLGCFADDTKESTKKIVNAYFPWNEDLAKEAKLDAPHYDPIKEPKPKSATFEYSIEIACSQDELNTYQVGIFSLGKTKEEANISSWNQTQTDKGFTLLTASVNVDESKTLTREFFISSGSSLSFDDVQPVAQGSGDHTESFIPVKPAVQVGDCLGWPTEGYFYHFINDLLIHEYKLVGDAKWAFQVTQSTKDHLTDELISNHQYSFILLPWKINKTVVIRQHLLYLPLKMSTKQLEELTPSWLNENGCLLDVDEIVQAKDEKKVTRELQRETSPPHKIQNVGQAVSFFNAYSTGGKRELRHNVIAIFDDNAIPQTAKILNLCKMKEDRINRIIAGNERNIPNATLLFETTTKIDIKGRGEIPDFLLKDKFSEYPIVLDLITRQMNDLTLETLKTVVEGGQLHFCALNFSNSYTNIGAFKIIDTYSKDLIPWDAKHAMAAYWIPQGKYLDIPKHPILSRQPTHIFTPSFSGCSFVIDELNENTLRIYHVEGNKENSQYNDIKDHGLGLLNYMNYKHYGYYEKDGVTFQNITGFAFMKYNITNKTWEIHYQNQVHAPTVQSYKLNLASKFFKESHSIIANVAKGSQIVNTGKIEVKLI